MTKKHLESKLRAIQELKAQRYIGTQEAWDYLNKISFAQNLRSHEELDSEEFARLFPGRAYSLRKYASYRKGYNEMSIENIRKQLTDSCNYDIINENLLDRYKRFKQEQIDHKLERRREILVDYINYVYEAPKTYEDVLESIDGDLAVHEEWEEDYSPSFLPKDHTIRGEFFEFIKRLILTEKNFITRYLKS